MSWIKKLQIQHVALIALLIMFIVGHAKPIADPDVWWHLKTGLDIIDTGQVPREDRYTFSNMGHEWIAHEWLAEVIYAFLYKAGGYHGLVVINIIVLGLISTMAFHVCYRRTKGNLTWSVIAVLFIAVILSNFWTFRPHMFGYLFFTAYLFILYQYEKGQDYLIFLPLLMLLWVNSHGSYIIGIILMGFHLVAHLVDFHLGRYRGKKWPAGKRKKFLFVLGTVVLATLLNPNTYHIWLYPFTTVDAKMIVENIEEWMAPNFHHIRFQVFALLLAGVIFSLLLSSKKISVNDGVYLLAFTALTMFGGRNMALFALACFPIGVEHASEIWPFEGLKTVKFAALNWVLVAVLLVVGILNWPVFASIEDYGDPLEYPVGAVEFIIQHQLNGRIFNDYNWGGYILWKCFPENRPFVDGRTDIFVDRVLPDYVKIIEARQGAYETLMDYDPDYILVPPDVPLNTLLKDKEDWRLIYHDPVANLFAQGR
ncbi:hypothetical protein Tfer_1976 [Thermincola ferriacetica]|uniref:Glycosyltransferase RgtA/B/C/D-like domain-containing protein n=1 Tax=Thermincola ferriacetica TaxID=281456 RepID=A0A0L6W2N1_9FIRM|nr:hypothetical protein [Thermincola ferriacetica]KNZ69339.1 hypothetical protein Tfer_1976 [Thermincola ferriacetica]